MDHLPLYRQLDTSIKTFEAIATGRLGAFAELLGHRYREMTEHYVRARMGERVRPLR